MIIQMHYLGIITFVQDPNIMPMKNSPKVSNHKPVYFSLKQNVLPHSCAMPSRRLGTPRFIQRRFEVNNLAIVGSNCQLFALKLSNRC